MSSLKSLICGDLLQSASSGAGRLSREDRSVGVLLGQFVGDALGAGVEGYSRYKIASHKAAQGGQMRDFIKEFHMGADQYGERYGMYTDDTNAALALAQSMVTVGGLNPAHAARTHAEFFLHEPRRGCPDSAQKMQEAILKGLDYRRAGSLNFASGSFANGAAMKIGPLGVAFSSASDAQLYEAVEQAVLFSHIHPEAVDGAWLLAKAISWALTVQPDSTSQESKQAPVPPPSVAASASSPASADTSEDVVTHMSQRGPSCSAAASPHVPLMSVDELAFLRRMTSCARTASMRLKCLQLLDFWQQASSTGIGDVEVVKVIGNGFQIRTIDAVPLVLWAFARHWRDPEQALINIVGYGGDTDTTAAMLGALLGALHGTYWIPRRWALQLEDGEWGRSYAVKLGLQLAQLQLRDVTLPPGVTWDNRKAIVPGPVEIPSQASVQNTKSQVDALLSDSLQGCVFGAAIGDAWGLATETLSATDVRKVYLYDADLTASATPEEKQELAHKTHTRIIPFPDFMSTSHSCQWLHGDWSDEIDHLVLVLRAAKVEETAAAAAAAAAAPVPTAAQLAHSFALKLHHWSTHGFPELGDRSGVGLDKTTKSVLRHRAYTQDPQRVAADVYKLFHMEKSPAGSGCLIRAVGAAFLFCRTEKAEQQMGLSVAAELCRCTHVDSRSIGACVALASIMGSVLRNTLEPGEIDLVSVRGRAMQAATPHWSAADAADAQRVTNIRTWSELALDADNGGGDAFKALACVFIALRHVINLLKQGCAGQEAFCDVVHEVVWQGGDSATLHASLAGAVLGALLGRRAGLPPNYIQALRHVHWLESQVVATTTPSSKP